MQIEIKIDDADVQAALGRILERLADPVPLYRGIGELLLDSTKERIRAGGPAPDGTPWAPLSSLYQRTKKGPGKLREAGHLLDTLVWQADGDGVAVGSNRDYARIHQLGGMIKKKPSTRDIRLRKVGGRVRFAKKSHKKTRTVTATIGAHTIEIPARPYLGLSAADQAEVTELVKEYFGA